MPRLPQFEVSPQETRLSIPEGGAEAFSLVGRRTGAFYHQIGQDLGTAVNGIQQTVQKHQTMEQISHGAAAFSGLAASLSQQISQETANADPNDTTLPQRLREQVVEPKLQEFMKSFDGATDEAQKWAMEHVDSLRTQLSGHIAGEASRMAGDAVMQNLTVTQNNLGALVTNDPTQFDYAMGIVKGSLDAMIKNNPNISGEDAQRLRTTVTQKFGENLAKAAVTTMALKNPDAAEAAVKGGAFSDYLSAGDTINGIREIGRVAKADATNARIAANQAATEASQATASKYLSSIADPNTGKITVPGDFAQKALQDPRLKPQERMALVNFAQSQATKADKPVKDVTDTGVYDAFRQRLALDPDDPRSLTASDVALAKADHTLSDKDYTVLAHAVTAIHDDPRMRQAEQGFNKFTAGMKSAITKSNPLMKTFDSDGDQQFYNFTIDAHQKWVAAGRDPAMLDPKSSNYLGGMVPQYQTNTKGAMARFQSNIQNGPQGVPVENTKPQRNPGESAGDYLKRVGGQ